MTSPRRGQTADPFRDVQDLEDRIERLTRRLNSDVVTSLPDNPYNGQVIDYLVDPTNTSNSVIWHLRYRLTSPNAQKWEYRGGSNYASGISGSITTASTTFVALTSGPTLTLPLTGIYEINYGIFIQQQVAGANNMIADIAQNGTDTGLGLTMVGIGQFHGGNMERTFYLPSLAAGTVLSSVVRTPNALSTTFSSAQLLVRPVRVG